MIDEPVVNASSKRSTPNSVLLQRITSSHSREMWTMQMAATAMVFGDVVTRRDGVDAVASHGVEAELFRHCFGVDGVGRAGQRGAAERHDVGASERIDEAVASRSNIST